MLLTVQIALYLICVLILLIALLWQQSTRNFDYWKKRNVPGPKPQPIIRNIGKFCNFQTGLGDIVKYLYNSTDKPYMGFFIFDEPCLLINSPELIKNILIQDFHYFRNRTMATPKHDEIVANLLFAQKGNIWKTTRQKVTHVFTTTKIRNMFSILHEIGTSLVVFLKNKPGTYDVKDLTMNYTTDVTARCFFGVDAYSFEDESSSFTKIAKGLTHPTLRNGFSQAIYFFKTSLVDLLHLNFFDEVCQSYFVNTFLKTVEARQEASYPINDFITTLIDMKKEDKTFDSNRLAALGIQFFVGGFETTSSTIAFTLFELAKNVNIQQKARAEIKLVIEKAGSVTYDSLKEMKYLDMCLAETLRKYPIVPFLDRRCEADYHLPGTDLVIEKGIAVYISVLGIHNDEKYFPEPQKYNPDRFEESLNKEQLIYFPFGDGPRICVGEKFGRISVKLALIHVLSNFLVEVTPETPTTIDFSPKNFTLQHRGPVYLKFKAISGTAS